MADATAAASVTGSSAGESISTVSYCSRSSSSRTSVCFDARSSLGFGGSGRRIQTVSASHEMILCDERRLKCAVRY